MIVPSAPGHKVLIPQRVAAPDFSYDRSGIVSEVVLSLSRLTSWEGALRGGGGCYA